MRERGIGRVGRTRRTGGRRRVRLPFLRFWLRLGRAVRPGIVAVALAVGSAGGCGSAAGASDARWDGIGDTEREDGLDGEVLTDVRDECEPRSFYGPGPVCRSDADCTRAVGWCSRCTGSASWSDGCGGWVTWRWCEPGYGGCGPRDADADADAAPDADTDDGEEDCTVVVWYGPSPLCETNAECEAEHGPGWVCDGYEEYPDTCGGTVSWGPVCRPTGDADAGPDGDPVDADDDPE